MRRHRSPARLLWISIVVLGLVGCATSTTTSGDRTALPITELDSVVGKWAGLLDLRGGRQEDYAELSIDRGGTYRVTGARTIGTMDTGGTVQVSDGRLILKGQGTTATATLYTRGGQRMLVVEGTGPKGAFQGRLDAKP